MINSLKLTLTVMWSLINDFQRDMLYNIYNLVFLKCVQSGYEKNTVMLIIQLY